MDEFDKQPIYEKSNEKKTIEIETNSDGIFTCDTGLSCDEWIKIISDADITSLKVKNLLIEWYKCKNHESSCTQMAEFLGKPYTRSMINMLINQYTKKVCKLYSLDLFCKEDNTSYRFPILMDGKHYKNLYIWILKDEVVEALEKLNLVDKNSINIAKETMDIEQEEIKENAYTINNFLNDVFISKEEYYDIIELLKRKKNIILSGAPGVGKSYMAKKLAYAFMGEINHENIEMVQFHQSYSYEDFIYGYQANGTGFELTPGIFYQFSKKASENKDKPYFFIIDEINRGNLSKIFGELFMLIENDKRENSSLILSHNKEKFTIPNNLYIIGMMNTADRSLAMVDYALRRRFSFVKVKPAFNSDSFKKYLKRNNTSTSMIDKIVEKFTELNNEISIDASLGEDFEIGHSYFCDSKEAITEDIYQAIIKYDIKPILDEYYFDNKEKAEELYKKLIR